MEPAGKNVEAVAKTLQIRLGLKSTSKTCSPRVMCALAALQFAVAADSASPSDTEVYDPTEGVSLYTL